LKSIDIINVLSDLVSEKLETTVKLPAIMTGILIFLRQQDSILKEGIFSSLMVSSLVILTAKRKWFSS
ncbi:hypothetical protein, partial [uncultured Catenibacterium sp.]|uniref:hypothetical protein n=1 Tax=uncultured Catenibacterium sp. TaxID=286142 RepID=UPI002598C92D